jgi:hypothetical protein
MTDNQTAMPTTDDLCLEIIKIIRALGWRPPNEIPLPPEIEKRFAHVEMS